MTLLFHFFCWVMGTEVNVLSCSRGCPPNCLVYCVVCGKKFGRGGPRFGCRGMKLCGGGHHGPPAAEGPKLGRGPPGINPALGIGGGLDIFNGIGGGPICGGAGLTLRSIFFIMYCSGPVLKNSRIISTTAPAPNPNLNFSRASLPWIISSKDLKPSSMYTFLTFSNVTDPSASVRTIS